MCLFQPARDSARALPCVQLLRPIARRATSHGMSRAATSSCGIIHTMRGGVTHRARAHLALALLLADDVLVRRDVVADEQEVEEDELRDEAWRK